jgi:DNA primase
MSQLNLSYFAALRIIGDDEFNVLDEMDAILIKDELIEQSTIDRLHANIDGRGRDYLHSRKITDESIDYFELGYSSKQDMVTWPVHDGLGELRGMVGRTVAGKRFKNSKGFKKSLVVYNLHRVWINDVVFVVEASFNVMRLHQAGLPAVATLGAGISIEQVKILKQSFGNIIVIPDDDEAGELMLTKIHNSMPDAKSIVLPDDFQNLEDSDLATLLSVV